jgi:hypothetical protein
MNIKEQLYKTNVQPNFGLIYLNKIYVLYI